MGKIIGIDLGTTNSCVSIMDGGKARVIEKLRGRSHHALDRRLHQGRRSAGRRLGQAPGGDQPEEHLLRGEAPDRPQVHRRRSAEGHLARAVRHPGARQRRRLGADQRCQAHGAAGNLRTRAGENEEDRGRLPRREGHRSGDHGAGVLQRQPASGHQGRWPHRRSGRQAHHQRADRRSTGLWPGQEGRRPQDCGVRPGRRHLRRVDHRDR